MHKNSQDGGVERTNSDAASSEQKSLRGSKLDAVKRDEFDASVAHSSEWSTDGWKHWMVTGRVLPERCDVSVPRTSGAATGAGGRVKFDLAVDQSLVIVWLWLEKRDATIFEVVDTARSALAFPVDFIAFKNRGAYEVVLDLCVDGDTGEAHPIPIYEPIFEVDMEARSFKPESSGISIPWSVGDNPELPTALHDLTSAVRYPRRTFEYCRMAVEALRAYFDPPAVKSYAEKSRAGEEALCSALKVTRASLKSLDAVAARSRHGQLVVSIDWEMRKRALEMSWELVSRFIEYLQGGTRAGWATIDLRIE